MRGCTCADIRTECDTYVCREIADVVDDGISKCAKRHTKKVQEKKNKIRREKLAES